MVNLDLYKVFYTVAKSGSLTKAAEELYISQPAVSRSIKQLEMQLGVTLFTRTHRGMVLSAQGGKMIFEEVERALGLLSEAQNRITQMNGSPTGTLRIGASDTIFEYFLADKIVEFHEKFPAVKIELVADLTPETVEKLKADKCDVAFVNLPIAPEPDLTLYGDCMRLNDILIVGEKYKSLASETLRISELKDYPLILMETGTVTRKALDTFFARLGVRLEPSIETGSWDLVKRLVAKGMGVGIIPRQYALRELAEGTLFEVATDVALSARSVGMLVPKNRPLSYVAHAFSQVFKK